MLTMKFHNQDTDAWHVMTCTHYATRMVGKGVRLVKIVTHPSLDDIRIGEDPDSTTYDQTIPVNQQVISNNPGENEFTVCYVVNHLGNTVDRITP